MSPRIHNRGFTLMEVLAVLLIIGIVIGFATLSLGGDRAASDRLQHEARRLNALLHLASDHAVLYGVELGLDVTRKGYQFLRLTTAGWQPITATDSPFHTRDFAGPMHLLLVHKDSQDLKKLVAAQNDSDSKDDSNSPRPEAVFLSSGEVTPFTLVLHADNTQDRYQYSGKLTGKITMQAETEADK